MVDYYIEKDGWHASMSGGGPAWVETNPTYNQPCHTCHGNKTIHDDNCECGGLDWNCAGGERCWDCGGKGKKKDPPAHPKPDMSIIYKLEEALHEVMKQFGETLDDGSLEAEIAKQKALEDSMKGASL